MPKQLHDITTLKPIHGWYAWNDDTADEEHVACLVVPYIGPRTFPEPHALWGHSLGWDTDLQHSAAWPISILNSLSMSPAPPGGPRCPDCLEVATREGYAT